MADRKDDETLDSEHSNNEGAEGKPCRLPSDFMLVKSQAAPYALYDKLWKPPSESISAKFASAELSTLATDGGDVHLALCHLVATPSLFADAVNSSRHKWADELANVKALITTCDLRALQVFKRYLEVGIISTAEMFKATEEAGVVSPTGHTFSVQTACARLAVIIKAPRFLAGILRESAMAWMLQRITVEQIGEAMKTDGAFDPFLIQWSMTPVNLPILLYFKKHCTCSFCSSITSVYR